MAVRETTRDMRRFLLALFFLLAPALAAAPAARAQDEPQPVVRALMFWMDTCGHCHYVLENVLPPLEAKYGEQLDITLFEIAAAADADVLYAAARELGLDAGGVGVPLLIIGDYVLTGSEQIPAELPGLIETYLEQGGVNLPPLKALEGVIPPGVAAAPAATLAPVVALPVDTPPAAAGFEGERLAQALMVVMVAALVAGLGGLWLARGGRWRPPAAPWLAAVVPALAALGLLVAGYLTYVETQAAAAVCGPVGDCNAVQTSDYARLFGIPIGLIGVAGYVAILLVWAWGQSSGRDLPNLLLVGMTAFGVGFSIYLTWLELYVIYAVCIWCISSAIIMTLLLLAAAGLAAAPWAGPDAEPSGPALQN